MFVEQLIKKKEENMISGLWRRKGVFISFGWLSSLLFSHSFYIVGNPSLYFTK
jgi:hypothetical protein